MTGGMERKGKTMRLIDADELPRFGHRGGLVHWKDIEDAPTIDAVEVVNGEWTEKEVIQDKVIEEWQSARCSNCGRYHTTPYMYYFDDYDFCPNCGAMMKGERNEVD